MYSKVYPLSSDIDLLLSNDTVYHTEVLVGHHLLIWVISGQTKVEQSDASMTFAAGSRFLLSHNQVVRLKNSPMDGLSFKVLTIRLADNKLKDFYAVLNRYPSFLPVARRPFEIKSNVLPDIIYKSLVSLYDQGLTLDEHATRVKIFEVLRVLRTNEPQVDNILGSFEIPGKLDLAKFMEGHFKFNISIANFGQLTGRSVSAFNRDFRKIFGMPPQKWLTKKRLELAFQMLTVLMKKPVEVYREVGFEDLSHFSFAFKKQYGHSPKDAIS